MNALEIKPGKYRTRDGQIVSVGLDMADPPQVIGRLNGAMMSWRSDGRASNQKETPIDFIARIEDEPKAEDGSRIVGAVECSVGTGKQVRGFVTKAAYDALWNVIGCERDSYIRELTTARCMVLTADEYDALVQAARVVDTANTYAKEACAVVGEVRAAVDHVKKRIASLEAENESLSRQLRSRALNSEPVATGKKWRWSPMV
jgi:hypothetical protein